MPNHVTSRITPTGSREHIDALFAHARNQETDSPFECGQILPMPPELEGTISPTPDGGDAASRQANLEAKYGYGDWYTWCCANWGTKWGAYNVSRDGDTVQFDSAWACPLPVLIALSAAHPEVTLRLEFADEDIGSNCGSLDLKQGVITWVRRFAKWCDMDEAQRREAKLFAASVKGFDLDEREAEYAAEGGED